MEEGQYLRFAYVNAQGEVSQRELSQWQESGHYIRGHCMSSNAVKTFHKDRVQQYLDGCDSLLVDPYAPPPPKPSPEAPQESRPQILFTGFAKPERAAFEAQAVAAGLAVVSTVTKNLTFLACGGNAGPTKVEKSRQQGTFVVLANYLDELFTSGILPDEI
ncbi:hypothetical protein [Comamonas terrigena]|uniref:hypothetical protein n=1 Tax=Comamonas terrigena TaxID=32013 RepID=UPI00289F2281|nr:hypothetical protein [Comamonas terrigena]